MGEVHPDADTAPCAGCGRSWLMLALDAKPGPEDLENSRRALIADGMSDPTPLQIRDAADFNRLEGPCCYGTGYLPTGA